VRRTIRSPLATGASGSPGQGGDPTGLRHRVRSRAATLRVYAIAYALVRRTMRSPLAGGASGSPGRAATLRIYTTVYALACRTMGFAASRATLTTQTPR
jgi:hypothetical protein